MDPKLKLDDWVGRMVDVVIDRPMGTTHPRHSNMVYPVNYGYVPGTMAPDGHPIDAFVLGADHPLRQCAGRVIAAVRRRDDVEDKFVVALSGEWSTASIKESTAFQEQWFHSWVELPESGGGHYGIGVGHRLRPNSTVTHPLFTPVAESPLRSLPGRPSHPYYDYEHAHQLRMVRPSTSIVGIPDVPEDYELRQYRPDDEGAYKDLFNLGFTGDHLEHTLTQTIADGFFVIEHTASGQIVASCVAERGSWDGGPERGILGWLIRDPSRAGLGLGTIVAARVTNRLAEEGYNDPGLSTEDFRLAAIGIYLKLGWRPYLYLEEMERRWRETCARLGRRFLREECVEP